MPIPGARFRVKTTSKGKKVRLAFKGNKVVEAKNLATGATHTPAEFKREKGLRKINLPMSMPSYEHGGKVKETGPALLHKGETVVPRSKTYDVDKMLEQADKGKSPSALDKTQGGVYGIQRRPDAKPSYTK